MLTADTRPNRQIHIAMRCETAEKRHSFSAPPDIANTQRANTPHFQWMKRSTDICPETNADMSWV